MSTLLTGATLPDGTTADVSITDGRISAISAISAIGAGDGGEAAEHTVDLRGFVLVPAFVEPHAHLDKAFLAEVIPNPKGDLLTAVLAMRDHHGRLSPENIAVRAERAIRTLVANGVTRIRTHADCSTEHGLRSVEGIARARAATAHLCDTEIVLLANFEPAMASLLREAFDAGADVVGGCPHLEPDPYAAMAGAFTLAAELGRRVDLHTDETLHADTLNLVDMASWVRSSGFPHPVAASHCVSLGVQSPAEQARIAALVAEAGIAVITLPQTNLFLQGRDHPQSTPRGLTAVRALLDAGATVAGGADNLQDPFNLMGRGDPLETAALLVMAGHLTPDEALHAVTTAGRAALGDDGGTLTVGAPADLVAVPGSSVREAMAFGPPGRWVWKAGTLVVRDGRIL